MKVQGDLLNKLRVILLASCHAKGCDRVSKCPRQCGCRTRRTFKLNTETAICWEIADQLRELVRYGNRVPLKAEVEEMVYSVYAYEKITRFHMSKGWQNFFLDLAHCIKNLCEPPGMFSSRGSVDNLKSRLNKLKRYPRD